MLWGEGSAGGLASVGSGLKVGPAHAPAFLGFVSSILASGFDGLIFRLFPLSKSKCLDFSLLLDFMHHLLESVVCLLDSARASAQQRRAGGWWPGTPGSGRWT